MPIEAIWDSQTTIWTLVAGESFTLEEIIDVVEKTDWRGADLFLWDVRDLKQGPASSQEVRDTAEVVQTREQIWSGSRAAIVVSRDLDYGIARMFQTYAEQVHVTYRIFRDRDEALAWLVEE